MGGISAGGAPACPIDSILMHPLLLCSVASVWEKWWTSGMQRLVCMFERLFALCPNKRRVSDPSDPDRRCIDDEGECSLCVTPSVLNLWCDLSSLSVCRLVVGMISRAFQHGAEVSGH